jgi:hypothetical protein
MGVPVGHWARKGSTKVYTPTFATREGAERAARRALRGMGPEWYATRPFEWATGWFVYIQKRD